MAKQSGIHQIKGKVGEMSYYKTKGVDGGLIRSINQGLSARVKSDAAYANTRLNMAEFKNANAIATAAFNSVNTRKRGMMVNFAIAAMTKKALEDIKNGTGDWGARTPATELDQLICTMLEQHAKSGPYNGEYGIPVDVQFDANGDVDFDFQISAELATELKSLGIDAITYVCSKCLAGEGTIDGVPVLFAGSAIGSIQNQALTAGTAASVNISGALGTPAGVGMSPMGYTQATADTKHGFYLVVSILPARSENGKLYTLQELCTYVALPLGQIPEE